MDLECSLLTWENNLVGWLISFCGGKIGDCDLDYANVIIIIINFYKSVSGVTKGPAHPAMWGDQRERFFRH